MFCPECGETIQKGKFCVKCGTPLKQGQISSGRKAKPMNVGKERISFLHYLKYGLVGVLTTIVCSFIGYQFGGPGQPILFLVGIGSGPFLGGILSKILMKQRFGELSFTQILVLAVISGVISEISLVTFIILTWPTILEAIPAPIFAFFLGRIAILSLILWPVISLIGSFLTSIIMG